MARKDRVSLSSRVSARVAVAGDRREDLVSATAALHSLRFRSQRQRASLTESAVLSVSVSKHENPLRQQHNESWKLNSCHSNLPPLYSHYALLQGPSFSSFLQIITAQVFALTLSTVSAFAPHSASLLPSLVPRSSFSADARS